MLISSAPLRSRIIFSLEIHFTYKDVQGILAHEEDSMVINLQIFNWNVKRVLVDLGISVDVLYWDVFERLQLDPKLLQHFKGSLVGLDGEYVHVHGYISALTMFGRDGNTKIIKVKYLVVNSLPHTTLSSTCQPSMP